MRDRLLLVLIVAAAMVISTVAVKADVPTLIGYQGVITDSEGEPITGVHNVTFTNESWSAMKDRALIQSRILAQ